MTQTQRVLAALRQAGSQGICQVDFFAPHVLDGGKPITRLAARVLELRDEGHTITSSGTRHGCAIYRLVETRLVSGGAPASPGEPHGHALPATVAPSESALFDPAALHEPLSPYDTLSDAA